MSARTLTDAGAPTLVVRIYDHDRLLTREFCESEVDAAAVVEHWSDQANLFVVSDDLSPKRRPEAIASPGEPLVDDDRNRPIALAPVPGCGTE